eukprot:TRINITY_DN28331_c0_g1_i1.p1 TRINITY_DN28331_c0_g1~~TRINITY_DN28331_c0_g1_i1.p1  ORF type:complete len:399 (-),score=119.93 TRINITY_DN28331_c0_g1_i1:76-1272(-)
MALAVARRTKQGPQYAPGHRGAAPFRPPPKGCVGWSRADSRPASRLRDAEGSEPNAPSEGTAPELSRPGTARAERAEDDGSAIVPSGGGGSRSTAWARAEQLLGSSDPVERLKADLAPTFAGPLKPSAPHMEAATSRDLAVLRRLDPEFNESMEAVEEGDRIKAWLLQVAAKEAKAAADDARASALHEMSEAAGAAAASAESEGAAADGDTGAGAAAAEALAVATAPDVRAGGGGGGNLGESCAERRAAVGAVQGAVGLYCASLAAFDPTPQLRRMAFQAVARDDDALLTQLLDTGGLKLDVQNAGGQTLLDVARERRRPRVEKLLNEMLATVEPQNKDPQGRRQSAQAEDPHSRRQTKQLEEPLSPGVPGTTTTARRTSRGVADVDASIPEAEAERD